MKRSFREHVSILLFSVFCTAVYLCFFSDAFFSTLFEADATMYMKWKKKKKKKANFLLWQLRWRGSYHILLTTSTSERLNEMLKTVVQCKGVKVQVRKTGKYVVVPKKKYKASLELHFLVARLQCQNSNCRL